MVVRLGQQLLERDPKHALVREATQMLCRALGAKELPSAYLMTGGECAPRSGSQRET